MKHEYDIPLSAGGALSVKVEKDQHGRVEVIGLLTSSTLITLVQPKLVVTHTSNNVTKLVFKCLLDDIENTDVTVRIMGDSTALFSLIDYIIAQVKESVTTVSSVKKPAEKVRTFIFEELDDRPKLMDEKLNRLFGL